MHHQDEELDLFPALLNLEKTGLDHATAIALRADIDQLEREHQQLEHIWLEIEPWLDSVAAGQTLVTSADLNAFVELYDAHMQREQERVFPHTSRLSAERRKQVCIRMAQRRGLTI